MSGTYMKGYAGCPFYRKDDGRNRVSCEGLVDRSTVSLSFERPQDFRQHTRIFCCDRYICCEIYRMLMDNKYEEDN